MPTVEFKLYPPEFRWGENAVPQTGGLWIARGIAAADTTSYNTTTLRYLSMGSPLEQQGVSTAAGATFRAAKPFTLSSLALLFASAFPIGASASFRFNINGTTREDIQMDLVAGETKKVAKGTLVVAQDDMVCLECTAFAGGTPDIQSMSLGFRTRRGVDPSI